MAELSGRSVSTVKKAKTSVSRGHTDADAENAARRETAESVWR
jgi:hypothetical protein